MLQGSEGVICCYGSGFREFTGTLRRTEVHYHAGKSYDVLYTHVMMT